MECISLWFGLVALSIMLLVLLFLIMLMSNQPTQQDGSNVMEQPMDAEIASKDG